MLDLAIVGAGPIGLETAILAKRAGLDYVVLEKGSVVNAIVRYPTYMTFFTTSERLEIGGHPLVSQADKPTRKEALDYYRKVVQNEDLNIRLYTEVSRIEKQVDAFRLQTRGRTGESQVAARRVAVATGYYDHPKLLGIPGENLPFVSHYYTEAHPFYRQDVVIVGAGSSAADAALDLYRAGARVTMIHRGEDFRHSLKYWIRPNLENRVKEGSIGLHLRTVVERIEDGVVFASKDGEPLRLPADQVFLLTGYYAPPTLVESAGVVVDSETLACDLDPESFESNVPGLYLIGSAGHGTRTSDVFIENGIEHARKAMAHIEAGLRRQPVEAS